MKKFKMFFDIEKEEQWLNEQLQEGYRCTHISGWNIYTFEKTDKNYVIRLDYQDYLPKKKLEAYKEIYEDFGWHYITDTLFGGIRYWQKEADGQNEIFSDRQSKSNYYKRLMGYSLGFGLVCLAVSPVPYLDSGLYHEGLWRMTGALFWKAFVFDTPFVLLKLSPILLFCLFAVSAYQCHRKYSILKEK